MARFDSFKESFMEFMEDYWNYVSEKSYLKLMRDYGLISSMWVMICLMFAGMLGFLKVRGWVWMFLNTSPACRPPHGRLFLSL